MSGPGSNDVDVDIVVNFVKRPGPDVDGDVVVDFARRPGPFHFTF